MNVKVLSIKPTNEPRLHEVLLSIGADIHKFLFTTEVNQVGDRLLQTTDGNREFSEVFRFNQRVAMNVSKLVVQFYNKEVVEFPADVGNFVTPEEAVSKLKTFQNDRVLATHERTSNPITEAQPRNAISSEVRHKAIALLEKLPDARLDEAVQFLESLSVRADGATTMAETLPHSGV
ncbi:MAG TPA: hypothetical protein DEG17_04740 [Cyanobacteria bacterium UBA11149]|nr:hypothetical protein [Cyanobacteria bacterium UBA11366]HBR74958.1 hypothetical protein [Cyanobacteria bacterium UBA11159]HBS71506.1 hypothetical protein [Cyanobacteria bacterium UBA11153]HBW88196.1 hypothetical protein [Cyanobacteria bacterium UBA11149]HCA94823.1 hypothetical protein [Cyanobacteria bacterium UBA9226]